MSFFSGNQQLDVLNITGSYESGTRTLGAIRLQNNSKLDINLDGLSVLPSNKQLKNPEQVTTLKIIIEWGDGDSESIAPFFQISDSSINVKFDPWTSVSHTYSLNTLDGDLTLSIYVYNSLNDCLRIDVPVTIQFQSLLESGAKFHLVSANITNDNKVSYVLNNSTNKASFVISTM